LLGSIECAPLDCYNQGSASASNTTATEADFERGKARGEKFGYSNERRATQQRTKSAPSLRAALQISPYGVAAFAKVVHIGCMLRLVWRNFEQQRGSRLKRE